MEIYNVIRFFVLIYGYKVIDKFTELLLSPMGNAHRIARQLP
jgi:hypothetical protein